LTLPKMQDNQFRSLTHIASTARVQKSPQNQKPLKT
jgi:hypothetical protein